MVLTGGNNISPLTQTANQTTAPRDLATLILETLSVHLTVAIARFCDEDLLWLALFTTPKILRQDLLRQLSFLVSIYSTMA